MPTDHKPGVGPGEAVVTIPVRCLPSIAWDGYRLQVQLVVDEDLAIDIIDAVSRHDPEVIV